MKAQNSLKSLGLITIALLAPVLAHANTGVGSTSGILNGVAHPLTGLDHICAMLAVGLWAAQRGGRAIWLVPLTFVLVMAFGGALGMAGVSMPFVEKGIVISVLALGVLVAAAVRLPLVASAAIVGLFALFHGHSHGTEMIPSSSGLAYGVGFVLATAALHALGISIGILFQQRAKAGAVRVAGSAIAGFGLYLLFAA